MPIDDALARLRLPHYPRTNRYDMGWILRNLMGPNPLWLMEAILDQMQLEPGMRVLDLGCGRAVSSIFVAKETGATVYATDLWIDAAGNWQRVLEAGAEDLVVPIHAEAHALPFADGFFDAVVSVDAYHYFGTDVLYLPHEMRALAEGLPNSELCWLTSPHGHDAFLIEQDIVLRAVREFRASIR